MEANRNAFVATVHVADDSSGESFGIGHYVNRERRFVPSDDKACAYGPRDFCTINTHHRFTASYAFAAEGQPFGITVTLEQVWHILGGIRNLLLPRARFASLGYRVISALTRHSRAV